MGDLRSSMPTSRLRGWMQALLHENYGIRFIRFCLQSCLKITYKPAVAPSNRHMVLKHVHLRRVGHLYIVRAKMSPCGHVATRSYEECIGYVAARSPTATKHAAPTLAAARSISAPIQRLSPLLKGAKATGVPPVAILLRHTLNNLFFCPIQNNR